MAFSKKPKRRGAKCTICIHPRCADIEHATIIRNITVKEIARQYAVDDQAVMRHRRLHVDANREADIRAREIELREEAKLNRDVAIVQDYKIDTRQAVVDLATRIDTQLKMAEDRGHISSRDAIGLFRELRACIDMAAKLQEGDGLLDGQVVLADSDAWLGAKAVLMEWVSKQAPDVRASFADAMQRVGNG